jgi:hypothetical protein
VVWKWLLTVQEVLFIMFTADTWGCEGGAVAIAFNFSLQYNIRKLHENLERRELIGTFQLLVQRMSLT